jgi:hypothetical protein
MADDSNTALAEPTDAEVDAYLKPAAEPAAAPKGAEPSDSDVDAYLKQPAGSPKTVIPAAVAGQIVPRRTILPSEPSEAVKQAFLQGVGSLKGPEWDRLDGTSKDPVAARQEAVNQTFWEGEGVPVKAMTNWPAARLAIAQTRFGYVGKEISEGQLFDLTAGQLKADAEAQRPDATPSPWTVLSTFARHPVAAFDLFQRSIALSSAKMPDAPVDKIPDITVLGGLNPHLWALSYNMWKPEIESFGNPMNDAIMYGTGGLGKAGEVIPMARKAVAGVAGLFSYVQTKQVFGQDSDNIKRIKADPNHTTADLARAYATAAADSAMAIVSGVGAMFGFMTPAERAATAAEMDGKTPPQIAETLKQKAVVDPVPEKAEAISSVAQQFDDLSADQDSPPEEPLTPGAAPKETPADETVQQVPGEPKPAGAAVLPAVSRAGDEGAADEDTPPSAEAPASRPGPAAPQDAQRETSLKNAVSEIERAGYGMEVATAADARAMAPRWVRAGEILQKDPEAGQRLADQLKANPNIGLTDDQSALLLRHKVGLENALNEANDILNDKESSPELKAEAHRQAKDLSQKLLDFMDAVHARGSEWGREGRWRQAMAKEDYSFSAQENLWRQAKGGRELTDAERADLNAKLATLKEKNDALQQRVIELSTPKGHAAAMDAAMKEMARPPRRPRVLRAAEAIGGRLHEQAEKSRAALAGKLFSVGPDTLYHLSVIGADAIYSTGLDFAKWSGAMLSEFGEKIKPHLQDVWDASRKVFNKENREALVDRLKSATEGKLIPRDAQISGTANELARGFIADGMRDRDEIVDAVHAELQKAIPDMSRREAMDAISGYGKYRLLTHDEVTDELRDVKGQLQQVSKLQDMAEGRAPAKTGMERRAPSDEERALIKQVEEAKKAGGYEVTDPEKQLKTALDSIKTRLTNQISDLERQIETREKIVKTKRNAPTDGEVDRLKARRDELKRQFDEVFGGQEEDARKARQVVALQKKIDAVRAKIEAGDTSTAPVKASRPAAPHLEPLKQELAVLNKELADLRGPRFMTDEQRLNMALNRMNMRRIELEEMLRNEDFDPKPRRAAIDFSKLDPAEVRKYHDAAAEVERAKQDVQIGREKIREANKSRFEKAAEQVAGAARFAVLTGYHTLGKLLGFSVGKLAEMPFTEELAAVIKRTPGFRDISSRASMEIGQGSNELGKFYAAWATKGMREAADIFRTGKGRQQAELGDRPMNARPIHWYDFPGLVHKFEKAPLLTADVELRIARLTAWSDANGIEVTDPDVQGAIRKEAYDYGQQAILQDKNIVSDAINGFIRRLEAVNPKTDRVNNSKVALAAFIKTFITHGIVKTPLNHIAQSLEASPGGLLLGLAKAGEADHLMNKQGVKALTPEEANGIVRLLKVGGVGSALFVWGAIDATKKPEDRMFGGFYSPGEKRDDKDAKWGRVRIDGHNLVLPTPIITSAQMGSTMMRVALSKLHKKDVQDKGIVAGACAAVLGLAASAPVVSPIEEAAGDVQRGQPGKLFWDQVTSFIPQLVQNIAVDMDQGKSRAPRDLKEAIESGIPVLRENVPETKAQLERDKRAKSPVEIGNQPVDLTTNSGTIRTTAAKAHKLLSTRLEALQTFKDNLPDVA